MRCISTAILAKYVEVALHLFHKLVRLEDHIGLLVYRGEQEVANTELEHGEGFLLYVIKRLELQRECAISDSCHVLSVVARELHLALTHHCRHPAAQVGIFRAVGL